LAQRVKARLAAGQQFMHIRLVTNIKNQAVMRCIKHGLDGDRQFHHAQIGRKVSSGLADAIHKKLSDLLAEQLSLFFVQRQQVIVSVDIA
jgi:hypothetical protein